VKERQYKLAEYIKELMKDTNKKTFSGIELITEVLRDYKIIQNKTQERSTL